MGNLSGLKFISVLFCLSIVFSSTLALDITAVNLDIMALSSLTNVEETVFETYSIVLAAEAAGANVSVLWDRLNFAGEYLALAKISLRIGNLEGADTNTRLSVESLEGIVEEAEVLKATAIRALSEYSQIVIVGSVTGIVTIILSTILGWNWFKKRYYKRVLEMKPEVVEGES